MKPSPRDEEKWEREDRNLDEMLQELRIALPGVQVLFAFLLAVPFQQRFGSVTEFQESIYFATLLLTAVSTFLLMAPTAFHRMNFRRQQKERMLLLSNWFSIAGLACLALAIVGAITLVTDFLYGSTLTIVTGSVALLVALLLWFLVPVAARNRTDPD